jgi:hypothetical protein
MTKSKMARGQVVLVAPQGYDPTGVLWSWGVRVADPDTGLRMSEPGDGGLVTITSLRGKAGYQDALPTRGFVPASLVEGVTEKGHKCFFRKHDVIAIVE